MNAEHGPSSATYARYSGMETATFVLHREPLLLLDRLVVAGDDYTVCEWDIVEGGPFVQGNLGIPAYIGIEFMAQCIAVHAGVRARIDGLGPPLGFLLGTRHLRTYVDWLGPGQRCQAACRELIRDSSGMGSYDCELLIGDKRIVEARLSVVEKESGRKTDDD
ncbi:MAG: hypothetical protein ACREQZ_07860 [Woeseiaceae bacterium]